jgi:hypothetical protein
MTMRALFDRKGQKFVATELCRGPRGTYTVHRGPVTALLARGIEAAEGAAGMFVTRVAVELLRPIPFEPLETSARVLRRGRPVEVVESVLSSLTSPVARMIAIRIRRNECMPPAAALDEVLAVAPAERAASSGTSGFHSWAVEHRRLRALDEPGHAADWMRLKVPLLSDETTSPLCRVCAVADVGLGLSSEPTSGEPMSEADLTVHMHRLPRGEWVCVDRSPSAGAVRVAQTILLCGQGSIGHAHRNQRVEGRDREPARSLVS